MESLIHNGIKCSFCQRFPIVGIRYKCLQCKSYDLCEECEKVQGLKHGHLLLKLRNNKQINMIGNNNMKKEAKLKAQPIEKPQSKCINSNIRFNTTNNNNFFIIPVKLINNGKIKWPLPCFFTCEENVSKVKGERVKLSNIKGEPGEIVEFKIKLDLTQVKSNGQYSTIWTLRDENGVQFGQKFLFIVKDTFRTKLELKPLYKIKKICAVTNETKPITTAEYLSRKGIK